jgi:phage shock protein PspC (stress-responsive transcriptional regulator)
MTKQCPACFQDIDARATRCAHCAQRQPDGVGLTRDVPGKLLGGVCAALALHFNWDLTLMRVAAIASLVLLGPLTVWIYLALWLMTPLRATDKAPLARFFEGLSRLFSPRTSGVEHVE